MQRFRIVSRGGAKRRSSRTPSPFSLSPSFVWLLDIYIYFFLLPFSLSLYFALFVNSSHNNCSRRSFSHAASLKCFAAHWDQCRRCDTVEHCVTRLTDSLICDTSTHPDAVAHSNRRRAAAVPMLPLRGRCRWRPVCRARTQPPVRRALFPSS